MPDGLRHILLAHVLGQLSGHLLVRSKYLNKPFHHDTLPLWNIKLHERAGIEIDDHLRSSRTIREIGLPLTVTGRLAPLGLPPLHEPIPFQLSSLASCASE